MLDLSQATPATFEPSVGDAFAVAGMQEPLVLEAVRPLQDGSGERSPFVLDFRGPRSPLLAQQTLRLQHPALGDLAIFLVPIGQDEHGTRYEAVFA